MNQKATDKQLINRAYAVARILTPKPSLRLAFNFINFQDYKYQFLADNIRHPTQVFVLEKFILLSQVFITGHGKSWFFHSHSQLKQSLGLDVKTVKKVVDALVERKILLRKKAGRTGKYHYKVEYAALMRHYRSFLAPEILEDKVSRTKVYVERLRYFAYMAKFCKYLKNGPVNDKLQIKTVESKESRKESEQVTYSPKVKQFVNDELGYEFNEDEDPDDYDPYPTRPKKSLTLAERIQGLKLLYPGYSDVKLKAMLEYR